VLTGALGSAVLAATGVRAQEITFFRILTGEVVGTYYAVGGLLATAISNPPGSLPCDQGGSCGVPGLVATSVASNGSIGNVADLAANRMQSALVQSDTAYWAYSGTGIYQGKPPVTTLRTIARLYPESVQLVASKKAGIASVRDLRGKRVSLDEENSGTQVDAKLILAAHGLSERDFQARYIPVSRIVDSVKDGSIDAFFRVAGWPGKAITELADTVGIVLVPIDGPEAAKLINQYKYFEPGEIPDNAYAEDTQR
jgi:TRAP transporter TAXI family solute receptor